MAEKSTDVTEEVTDIDTQSEDTELDDVDASFDEADEPEDDSEDEDDEEDQEDDDADGDDDVEDTEDEESEDTEDQQPEAELSPEEQEKQRNREMAEQRLKAKQERDAQLQAGRDEYLKAAKDEQDLALRQLQIQSYETKIEGNTNKLTNGFERAVKDFPILSDPDPAIRQEVASAIDAFEAQYLTIDALGNPADLRGDLYAYLQHKADSIAALTGKGARQQQQSKNREKSKVLTPPSRAPKKAKSDPMLEGFEEEANRW